MTDASHLDVLLGTLRAVAPIWQSIPDVEGKLLQLTSKQVETLNRVLLADAAPESTSALRGQQYEDFYQFDGKLNALCCEILNARVPITPLTDNRPSEFFDRNFSQETAEQSQLQRDGYQVSAHRLTGAHLKRIEQEIGDKLFTNRGIFATEVTGKKVLTAIADGSSQRFAGANGDTLWAKDLNQLCQNEYLTRLAFDPYILSTAAKYLGCTPIHVQTNIWFSFPTFLEKNNLSTNAQMFHQDKEFTKFLKVFIYLSDVGEDSGPHRYVEGSHLDEAHAFGIGFSDRIPDDEITRYYDAKRIKTLLGPAGTITFGDTSCVHKGQPVVAGHRTMLQFEYAASLYLSPVAPFDQMPDRMQQSLPYPEATRQRLTANYNSAWRKDFLACEEAQKPAEPSTLRKLMRLGKRYLKR